jgi:hypothetical protein
MAKKLVYSCIGGNGEETQIELDVLERAPWGRVPALTYFRALLIVTFSNEATGTIRIIVANRSCGVSFTLNKNPIQNHNDTLPSSSVHAQLSVIADCTTGGQGVGS